MGAAHTTSSGQTVIRTSPSIFQTAVCFASPPTPPSMHAMLLGGSGYHSPPDSPKGFNRHVLERVPGLGRGGLRPGFIRARQKFIPGKSPKCQNPGVKMRKHRQVICRSHATLLPSNIFKSSFPSYLSPRIRFWRRHSQTGMDQASIIVEESGGT